MSRFGRVRVFCAVAAVLLGLGTEATAEPMFLSKQYARCSACHHWSSGGGLLTSYGRSLSNLELSMTRRTPSASEPDINPSAEEAFLFGAFGDRLGPINLGIDLRPSHLSYAFGDNEDSRNLLMTADVIAAFQAGGWTAYGEVGREPTADGGKLDSYEHWVGYLSGSGLSVRAGRFLPTFGIRYSDHTTLTRSALGFDKYDQVYGVEVGKASGRWLTEIGMGFGRADSIIEDDGTQALSATARVQADITPRLVLVGSGFYRAASDVEERSGAVGGAVGYAPHSRVTIWTEANAYGVGEEGTSMIVVNETSFEAFRGLWLKFSPQARTGYGDKPGVFRWSAGVSFLPRTHWNAGLTFYRERASGSSTSLRTLLLQLHLYL